MRRRDRAGGWVGFRIPVPAAIFVLAGFFGSLGRTSAAADANELIREGVALRRNGEDAAALQRFQQAYQIEESPRAMAQIGLAEQALGRWPMAYEHLNGAIEAKGDPWIKKNRALIGEALNRVNEHVGRVEILGGSPGAEVRVGGVSRGNLPLARPIAVSTGTVIIDVGAPGFLSTQRTTVVRAGETTRESFDELTAIVAGKEGVASHAAKSDAAAGAVGQSTEARVATTSSSAAGSAPTGATATTADATGGDPAKDTDDSRASGGGTFRPKIKWLAWGLAAAAAGVGVYGALMQNRAGNDFANGCRVDPSQNIVVSAGSNKTVAGCRTLRDQVDSNYRIELIGLASAGVLAATGLIFWLTEPAPGGGETAFLSCNPALTADRGPLVSCRLRF